MDGYRDKFETGAHVTTLGGCRLAFGLDGVCWSPAPEEEAVLANRPERFELVKALGAASPADDVLTGPSFVQAAREVNEPAAEEPRAEEPMPPEDRPTPRRRRKAGKDTDGVDSSST